VGIITIARQAGSQGEAAAERVARDLGFGLVDRSRLESLTEEHGLTGHDLDDSDEDGAGEAADVHVDYLPAVLDELAAEQDIVILGRGGQFLFRDCPWSVHVKVVASLEARREAVRVARGATDAEAEAILLETDRQRTEWIRRQYGADWDDPAHYDLIVRTDRLGEAGAAAAIRSIAEFRGIGGHLAEIAAWVERRATQPSEERAGAVPGFKHPSEVELAKVLDFYRIRWDYEPRAFPLARDAEGNVTEAFRPDFYLPDLDLYLELTTLRQSLVREKNRKVRKFRELYPDIRLKVFYGRDFRSLVQKYELAMAPRLPRTTEVRP
jgi:cytidylate kinase